MSETPRGELERAWRDYGCRACVHFRPHGTTCEAYPDGIPIEVASGQERHLDPLPGDHGIRFEAAAWVPGTTD